MKKIFCNVMALAMVAALACSATACNIGTTIVEDVDETKTQLYIASYSGGGGYKWLDDPNNVNADDAEKRFEDKYANTSFEDGKTGVQIIVDSNKGYGITKVETYLDSGGFDLYFAPGYYFTMASANKLLDITDVVTEVNSHDNKSIESKMSEETQSLMKLDGKYYALPYYDYFPGISYDADLFKDNMLYFSDQLDTKDTTYPGTNAFVTSKNATNYSCGPDAVYGTYDDGLPSTYQEFYKLMDRMVRGTGGQKITPIAFNGAATHYTNMFISALAANYVGVDGMKANIKLNSNGQKVEIVTGWDGNTPKTDWIEITQENAYLVKSTAGLYYASELCEKVFTNTQYYDTTSASQSMSNVGAMERFLKSGWEPSTPTPIAMIIDGSYWYNEAESEGVIERARKYDPSGNNGVKNVKFMPLPHQYAGTVTPKAEGEEPISQVLQSHAAYSFIAADIPSERVELAKLFLQFCYSDEELAKAELSNNGISRSLSYDTSSIQDQLPSYAKSLNEMKTQATANGTTFIYESQNPIYMAHRSALSTQQQDSYWRTALADADYTTVFDAYKTGGASAKEYFSGLAISESVWKSTYLK